MPTTLVPPNGAALYRLVEAYAALGDHRTGTAVDAATRTWFAAELQRRGARVERRPFAFDRYDAEVDVRIAGRPVVALPLYYEAIGSVATGSPFVASIGALDGEAGAAALADALAKARAAGAEALVVATDNPLGELQAPNRRPVAAPTPGAGLPVMLVAGREAEALRAGPVDVRCHARIVPGASENVLAEFGAAATVAPPPVLIATPLSGWFGCAAERGTGIAIALALAERVAARHAVRVVGSPGHELLPHIGLEAFLVGERPAASLVVHLGANVALGRRGADGRMAFIATRAIGARMAADRFDAVRPALAALGVPPRLDPPRWVGEGELWSHAVDTPLISFVGIGPQFHTPADTPAETTSPELMSAAFDAIAAALDAWLDLAEARP